MQKSGIYVRLTNSDSHCTLWSSDENYIINGLKVLKGLGWTIIWNEISYQIENVQGGISIWIDHNIETKGVINRLKRGLGEQGCA